MRQRDIFWFWLPLFASWLLMTAEGPIISATINRLPDEVLMLAAFGIVNSLSVLIESPIINLLATSTALVKDRASLCWCAAFTVHWAIFLTVISVLLAFTPLFQWVVIDLLDTPLPVAQWVKPGLQIMIFWSAAIGWRRFLQGVMIHFGQTRKVAWGHGRSSGSFGGTAVSWQFSAGGRGHHWRGLVNGRVLAEAAYATWLSAPSCKMSSILIDQLQPVSR
ncbi:MAG: hypothetical protein M5U34_17615 [Chloroflexi bacterium]|nr:hypothetical protein [Chloroflexota bacterium]